MQNSPFQYITSTYVSNDKKLIQKCVKTCSVATAVKDRFTHFIDSVVYWVV